MIEHAGNAEDLTIIDNQRTIDWPHATELAVMHDGVWAWGNPGAPTFLTIRSTQAYHFASLGTDQYQTTMAGRRCQDARCTLPAPLAVTTGTIQC